MWPVPENIEITVTLFKVRYGCLISTETRVLCYGMWLNRTETEHDLYASD